MGYKLTNHSSTIKSLLRKINWDFNYKGALSSEDIKPFDSRKFHWFPATYIPEIPFSLIEILTKEGAVVYDPFAGSGTTYFQAIMLNRQAITSDSNSISIRYIKSLATLMHKNAESIPLKENVLTILNSYDSKNDYVAKNLSNQSSLLRPWFHSNTLNEIAFIYGHYIDSEDSLLKALLYVLLAGSIKNVCSQNRGYGYIADNVKPKSDEIKYLDLINHVRKKVCNLIDEINRNNTKISSDEFAKRIDINKFIIQHNCSETNFLPMNSVDAIITSPPYPNMIDYSKGQRLLYYLFEMDFKDDLSKEIGARTFRSKKDSVETYIKQMKLVFDNLTDTLKVNGLFCLVLPHYDQTNPSRQNAIKEILDFFESTDYVKEDEYIRNINQARKVQNAALSSLDQELIVIYRKIS